MKVGDEMNLDEAIRHYKEEAQEKRYEYQECVAVHDTEEAMNCAKCGEEHEQLATWLRELKHLRNLVSFAEYHNVSIKRAKEELLRHEATE